MIYEYALEPDLLTSGEACEFLASNFGIPRGRLVSQFPEHWEALVYAAVADALPVEKLRITEALSRLAARVFVRTHDWDDAADGDWLDKAREEHGRRPFRAILATRNPVREDFVLGRADLHERTERWNVDSTCVVNRTAVAMAQCAEVLLDSAKEVVFADPYFQINEPRFRRPLQKFLEVLGRRTNSVKLLRVELHVEERGTKEFIQTECNSRFLDIIPRNLTLKIVRWKAHREFHNRYVLTNRGGLHFGQGLDDGPGTDDVSILSDAGHTKRWEQFQRATTPFEFVDEFRVQGRK